MGGGGGGEAVQHSWGGGNLLRGEGGPIVRGKKNYGKGKRTCMRSLPSGTCQNINPALYHKVFFYSWG